MLPKARLLLINDDLKKVGRGSPRVEKSEKAGKLEVERVWWVEEVEVKKGKVEKVSYGVGYEPDDGDEGYHV